MGRQMLKWGGGLIAMYLGVRYAPGLAQVLKAGASGTGTVVKDLQGR